MCFLTILEAESLTKLLAGGLLICVSGPNRLLLQENTSSCVRAHPDDLVLPCHLFEDPLSKYSTSEILGVRVSTYDSCTVQPIIATQPLLLKHLFGPFSYSKMCPWQMPPDPKQACKEPERRTVPLGQQGCEHGIGIKSALYPPHEQRGPGCLPKLSKPQFSHLLEDKPRLPPSHMCGGNSAVSPLPEEEARAPVGRISFSLGFLELP